MAIQKMQTVVGYQLMTIMVSTIKAHHLSGGSASPYGKYDHLGLIVDGINGNFGGNDVDADITSSAVRPLVCIPTSVFNSKYATYTTLVNQ